LVDNGPGTESDGPTSGLKPEKDNFDYTIEESEKGYENFTVIQCKIKSFEWLYLAAKGHRRAKFEFDNLGSKLHLLEEFGLYLNSKKYSLNIFSNYPDNV
jgi:pyridoxamine 5'-phosphate oxidase